MDGAADFSILPAKAIGTMTIDNFEGCANKCRCCKSAVYLLFLFAAFFCERTGIFVLSWVVYDSTIVLGRVIMTLKKGYVHLAAAVLLTLALPYSRAWALPAPSYNDPGVQLNKTREYLEKQRVAEEIAEGKEKKTEKIEAAAPEGQKEAAPDVRFVAKAIRTDKSAVLSQEEIESVIAKYVGKEIGIKDLQAVVAALNEIYADKGYLTCRAFLPSQTVRQGVVDIRLIEGRTGSIEVAGNKSTNLSYIRNRLHLSQDNIENVSVLNEDLLRFNATNDAQLRISLQAGEKPGTTDYLISVFEPQQRSVTVYADNAGYESSGLYREGLFFIDRSLTGVRDTLNISTIYSKGTESFSTYYARPVGRSGTKMTLQYSTNSVHVVDGDLEDMNVRGHAYSYGLGIVQPIIIRERFKSEVSLEYARQSSKTDFLGIHWLDDVIDGVTLAFSQTNYGRSNVLYQKHGYRIGNWDDIDGRSHNFGRFQTNLYYQKAYGHGQLLSAGLNAQLSSNNYLASAEQFYIGGAYSVRGYEESILSGDHGYSVNLEYAMPAGNKASVYTFFDYGSVHGDSAFDDHVLAGAGIGYKKTFNEKMYANISLGVPLFRDLNGREVSKTRVHFLFSGQF